MAVGKIRHWKHGWIPVSDAAKAYVAGVGPKPSASRAPNSRLGLPEVRVKSDRGGGERRGRAISELVPGIGTVEAHYRTESQDMPGHYTGGVHTTRMQTDTLVNHLERYGRKTEGEANLAQDARMAGQPITPSSKSSRMEQANNYANRIAAVVPELSGSNKPLPYYAPKPLPSGSYYDGGLQFSPEQADALIDYLGDSVHGGDDRPKTRR